MFHVKKPTPAPIFNHRKRPRQAVFADPLNDVMPGPSGAASAPPPPRAQFSGELIPKASENNLFGVFFDTQLQCILMWQSNRLVTTYKSCTCILIELSN